MAKASGARGHHGAELSAREALVFEAGVKLGGIFHQYLGTPVGPTTASTLARAIEKSVRLQPYVTRVRVSIDPKRGGPVGPGVFGYRYLTPPMLRVSVELRDGPVRVLAGLRHRPDLRFPLMRVERIQVIAARRRLAHAARSSGRRGPSGRRSEP